MRLAEPIAALSLATDLGLGRPLEYELGVCLGALELAERLGCDAEERADVYYLALLLHVGCSGAARYLASWVGGDEIRLQQGVQLLGPASEPSEDLRYFARGFADDRPLGDRVRRVLAMLAQGDQRVTTMAANLCEGASLLAAGLRMPDSVTCALGQLMERWDGNGVPAKLAGEQISRPLRIVRVAHDVVVIGRAAGDAAAMSGRRRRRGFDPPVDDVVAMLRRRRGRGYDPLVVDAALDDPGALLRAADVPDAWARVLDAEPAPVATISPAALPAVARTLGAFADVKVGFLAGHSSRVAALSGCELAGPLHDLGRLAVPNGTWEKRGPLSAAEQERVRLHPYFSERVLERSGAFAAVAVLAGSHHERLDGSGYHRGSAGAQLSPEARALAAADVYDALTHDRPHRPALSAAAARAELGEEVRAGRLDKRAVDGVLEIAGEAPLAARPPYPAGLSEREVEVLRLVALGRTSREIARTLVITEKTAGHHIEHIYAKLGVSTRVGATLFAMRHDLT